MPKAPNISCSIMSHYYILCVFFYTYSTVYVYVLAYACISIVDWWVGCLVGLVLAMVVFAWVHFFCVIVIVWQPFKGVIVASSSYKIIDCILI